MGARYSDRFFGADGASGRPLAPSTDTVDLLDGGETDAARSIAPPDHLEPPVESLRWYAHTVARAALVAALVIGAAGGAYGWDRWRDHQVEVAARAAVDVTVSAFVDSFNENGTEFDVDVMLRNDGEFPLQIIGVDPLDGRLTRTDPDWKPVELEPGADIEREVRFAIDCAVVASAGDPTSDSASLTAQLVTADGVEHDQPLDVDYYGGTISDLLTENCTVPAGYGGYRNLYADVVSVESVDEAVAATIALRGQFAGPEADAPVTYNAVASSVGFSTEIDDAGPTPDVGSPFVTVMWTVRDCTQALAATDLDMTVELTGQLPSEPTAGTLTGFPTPALSVALARLSERVCD